MKKTFNANVENADQSDANEAVPEHCHAGPKGNPAPDVDSVTNDRAQLSDNAWPDLIGQVFADIA